MRNVSLSLSAMALGAVLSLSSCHEVEETIANVVVLNDLGAPVQGATVRFKGLHVKHNK